MFRYIYSLVTCLLLFVIVQAQEAIIQTSDIKKEAFSNDKKYIALSQEKRTKRLEAINFHPQKLESKKSKYLSIFKKTYLVETTKLKVKKQNDFSWVGSIDQGKGRIILCQRGNRIKGIISYEEDFFCIETLSNGQFVVVDMLKDNHQTDCATESSKERSSVAIGPNEVLSNNLNNTGNSSFQRWLYNYNNNCTFRIAVFFTQKAAEYEDSEHLADMFNVVELLEVLMNESLTNSGLTGKEVSVVYVGKYNQTEALGYYTYDSYNDLIAFKTDTDVQSIQNQYSADACLLLLKYVPGSYAYGRAYTIQALNAQDAYALSTVPEAYTSQYVFNHEIGHLFGCRHDIDGNTTPYAYGHGYNFSSYRTIMSTNTGYTKINHFSNPAVSYGGYATGTSWYNNNATVIDNEFTRMMGLKEPPTSITFTSNDVSQSPYYGDYYGDVVANQTITTSNSNGNIVIDENDDLHFRSGSLIKLTNGFKVVGGGEFSGVITSISNCGPAPRLANTTGSFVSNFQEAPTSQEYFLLKCSPTVSTGLFNCVVESKKASPVTIVVTDAYGKTVTSINAGMLSRASSFSRKIDLTSMGAGLYFITALSKEGKQTQRVIVSK